MCQVWAVPGYRPVTHIGTKNESFFLELVKILPIQTENIHNFVSTGPEGVPRYIYIYIYINIPYTIHIVTLLPNLREMVVGAGPGSVPRYPPRRHAEAVQGKAHASRLGAQGERQQAW